MILHRMRTAVARAAATVAVAMTAAIAAMFVTRRAVLHCFGKTFECAMRRLVAGQPLNGGQLLLVAAGCQHEGGTGATGATRTSDAVHVIVRMEWHVEIEDMAH